MTATTSPMLRPGIAGIAAAAHSHLSLGVALRDGHYRVIALEPIAAGSELLQLHGVFVDGVTPWGWTV